MLWLFLSPPPPLPCSFKVFSEEIYSVYRFRDDLRQRRNKDRGNVGVWNDDDYITARQLDRTLRKSLARGLLMSVLRFALCKTAGDEEQTRCEAAHCGDRPRKIAVIIQCTPDCWLGRTVERKARKYPRSTCLGFPWKNCKPVWNKIESKKRIHGLSPLVNSDFRSWRKRTRKWEKRRHEGMNGAKGHSWRSEPSDVMHGILIEPLSPTLWN